MSDLDDFLEASLVKTAQAAPTPTPTPVPQQQPIPTVSTPSMAESVGAKMPWQGALLGGLGYGVYDYIFGDEDEGEPKGLGRFLRKGLTGAATGAGVELGTRVGGEFARRHAINNGSNLAVGMTLLIGAAGLGGLGYYLTREKDRDDS